MFAIPAHKSTTTGQIVIPFPKQTLGQYIACKQENEQPVKVIIDTQIIRNEYVKRPYEQSDRVFGDFAEEFLGITDINLRYIHNVSEACNYILAHRLNYQLPG